MIVLVALAAQVSAVEIDWTLVGNPGNPCDPQETGIPEQEGCFGSVNEYYNIGTYEVTHAQYTEFLNAKAASDPLGLYHPYMGVPAYGGAIARTGDAGSYSYAVIPGLENQPVNFVSFADALRFANWLHNGQGAGGTETGAYTLLGGTETPTNATTVTRNPAAIVFLPSEDQWYKAAYYNPVTASYFAYPTGSNTPPTCAAPGPTPNAASCDGPGSEAEDPDADGPTDVGSFTGSPSPLGTFDQGGNLWEMSETILAQNSDYRIMRGGMYGLDPISQVSWDRNIASAEGFGAGSALGFRVAPEPGRAALLGAGLALLVAIDRLRHRR